mgnify:CR=1 FL=1
MNEKDFLDFLSNKNFPKPLLVNQPANGGLDQHSHDFEVWALVVDGSIQLEIDGKLSTYKSGEVFHLQFKQEHRETYGPTGVSYLASRKSH